MTNVKLGKKHLAIAVMACLCMALIAFPAYGFYYVHDEGVSDAADGQGAYEIFCVVDETAIGGPVTSSLVFVPAGSTGADVLDEAIMSSENQNGLDAIHNYDVTSVAEALDGATYTVAVYNTGDSQPVDQYDVSSADVSGAYAAQSKGDENTVLDRYDNVVITVTAA
ncbi:MAG: hypothetical protein HFJ75_03095 [Eggerthellaceae bacterium]|nr:hypothetical protein [Eggerthellaceae bacterium]